MMKQYWLVLLLISALLASNASAAVIHGSVYDLELNTLSKAVVTINTAPQQVLVSQNGTYSFSVPIGSYEIVAQQKRLDLVVRENITISQQGDYVLDLILFPDLSTEESLLNETVDVQEYEEPAIAQPMSWAVALGVAALAVLAALLWRHRKRHGAREEQKEAKADEETKTQQAKPATKADLEDILAFVRKEGGRTTQKDLRKAIPYSEAKISLMIAELESQGKLKKIKKGRGNIIILP